MDSLSPDYVQIYVNSIATLFTEIPPDTLTFTQRFRVVRIMHMAIEECRKTFAFERAKSLVPIAIAFIPHRPFSKALSGTERKICLDVFSTAAEVEYIVGNFEEMKSRS